MVLAIFADGGADLFSIKGSPAGAFGLAQFEPISYRTIAVSCKNDDDPPDLFDNKDAICSLGNYLSRAGWGISEESHRRALAVYGLDHFAIAAVLDYADWLAGEKPMHPRYKLFHHRDGGRIVNKCAYIILGVNDQGLKEVLGIWINDTESAKFWMGILNELKNRGVEEILIACIDGIKGFTDAVKAIYPDAEVQRCIVHQIRNTIKFMPTKDRDAFCIDLRTVYGAPTEDAGREALSV